LGGVAATRQGPGRSEGSRLPRRNDGPGDDQPLVARAPPGIDTRSDGGKQPALSTTVADRQSKEAPSKSNDNDVQKRKAANMTWGALYKNQTLCPIGTERTRSRS
jgi:hypothetical protein